MSIKEQVAQLHENQVEVFQERSISSASFTKSGTVELIPSSAQLASVNMDLLAQLASVASSTLTSSSAAVPARMQLEPCPPQGAGHQPQLGPVMSGGFGGGFGGGFMAPPPFMVRPSSQLVTSGAECLVSMHASPSGPQQGVAGPGSGRRTRKRRAPAAFNDGAIAGFCNHPGCNKTAQGGTTRCKAHGGGRRCVAEGCTKSARGATDRCIAHGGGKVRAALLPPPLLPLLVPLPITLLTPPPCSPRALARSLAHPRPHAPQPTHPTQRCTFEDCTKSAQGATALCKAHGGGHRCTFLGCTRSARGATDRCIAHGGGKRCAIPGCHKSAQGATEQCKAHGGGHRCSFPGCTRSAQGAKDRCKAHGGGRRCDVDGCDKSARGSSSKCVGHGGGPRCSEPACGKAARDAATPLCEEGQTETKGADDTLSEIGQLAAVREPAVAEQIGAIAPTSDVAAACAQPPPGTHTPILT